MTQVDFYVLPGEVEQQREQFACRLAEKAYRLGHRIFIHTRSAEQTRHLDDLLWTFQQSSFVPHSIYQEAGDAPPPVVLAHDAEPHAGYQVLINLADDVPLFFSHFERVAELVNGNGATRESGRSRYGFYKERGYLLRTHEISN
ncbi:MAG: DNA polymerase III subunit chi [Thiogranum sp.]|nr:DNA polymerase III subunit chi [Thiogranum sp.]